MRQLRGRHTRSDLQCPSPVADNVPWPWNLGSGSGSCQVGEDDTSMAANVNTRRALQSTL
jgi:hypothetical protein